MTMLFTDYSQVTFSNEPTQDSKHKGIIKGTLMTRTGETD